MMFWGTFRGGKMGLELFFDLKLGQKINSVIYRDQILLRPLKDFYMKSLVDISEPIVMEDRVPVHKGTAKKPRADLKWTTYEYPPNSPNLNAIENI